MPPEAGPYRQTVTKTKTYLHHPPTGTFSVIGEIREIPERYQREVRTRRMGTLLTLALRECCTGSTFYRHRHLFVCDFFHIEQISASFVIFFGERPPCPNIFFVYPILLFYLRYLPYFKKVRGERLQGRF